MVSGEDLVGLVDVAFPFGEMFGFGEVIVDLADVDFGDPAVCVDDSQDYFFGFDSVFVEKLLLKVLCAPRNVAGFAFLFVVSDLVSSVASD